MKMGLRLMEVAQVVFGHVSFPSQSIGRMSSWAELRVVQKNKQPLKKGCRERAEKKEVDQRGKDRDVQWVGK